MPTPIHKFIRQSLMSINTIRRAAAAHAEVLIAKEAGYLWGDITNLAKLIPMDTSFEARAEWLDDKGNTVQWWDAEVENRRRKLTMESEIILNKFRQKGDSDGKKDQNQENS